MASLTADECVGAQDLGSSKSKLALAYQTSTSVRVLRVPFKGDFNDPERADTADQPDTNFDFVAFAALRDDDFVAGRQALSYDDHYPLKTILVLASGITREGTLGRLPGGTELLKLFNDGKITVAMMDEALKNHFLLLRRMMANQARQIKPAKKLTRLVLTYPNYLCPEEDDSDFVKYSSHYQKLMRDVWGEELNLHMVSEGQATAVYLSAEFEDPLSTFSRQELYNELRPVNNGQELSILIPDGGSSSLV